jgi:hypothetical protein
VSPPERHADRIIAAMLRDLARRYAEILTAVAKAAVTSKDGGPRAQHRMAERIRKAGAIDVDLKPGTRGRYELTILYLVGWDPASDQAIVPRGNEPLPPKPWLAVYVTRITNRGRDVTASPILFVTHHALSRCAQRFGVRTMHQVVAACIAGKIWDAMVDAGVLPDQLPPQGHRVIVDGGQGGPRMVVVLRRHETRCTLMATTVLFDRDRDLSAMTDTEANDDDA